MSLIKRAKRVFSEGGLNKLTYEAVYHAFERLNEVFWRLQGNHSKGESVYSKHWDVLVVIDACRYDLALELSEKNSFNWWNNIESTWSLGSSSEEWMEKNFTPDYAEEMSNTAHITANVYSNFELNNSDWRILLESWKDHWDDTIGTTPADMVIKQSIQVWEDKNPDKMIVHLMQPHAPFISHGWSHTPISNSDITSTWGQYDTEKTVWNQYRDGEISHDQLWTAYKDNLEYALTHIDTLLNSIDAETVAITADHGNALGEYGVYGHPTGIGHPNLRKVPYVTTTATKNQSIEQITENENKEITDEIVEKRLNSLGYK